MHDTDAKFHLRRGSSDDSQSKKSLLLQDCNALAENDTGDVLDTSQGVTHNCYNEAVNACCAPDVDPRLKCQASYVNYFCNRALPRVAISKWTALGMLLAYILTGFRQRNYLVNRLAFQPITFFICLRLGAIAAYRFVAPALFSNPLCDGSALLDASPPIHPRSWSSSPIRM